MTLTRAKALIVSASTQPTDQATSATAPKGTKAILTSKVATAVEVNFLIVPSYHIQNFKVVTIHTT